jgi:uncharacterized protein (TIGR03437 family)
MRCIGLLLFLPFLSTAQTFPFRLGDPVNLIAPATSNDGSTILFAASMAADGTPLAATNLFIFSLAQNLPLQQLTNYTAAQPWAGVTSMACGRGTAVYASAPAGLGTSEEVHFINTNNGADRTLTTDKEGCIQPLCIGCARPCVGPVHLSTDGTRVLYAVARQQPFFVVNVDGSGLTRLPVYQGGLAPSPKRAIAGGTAVFTSSAPSGPTFAAAATDVYLINLDGTGLKQVTKFGDPSFYAINATISEDGTLIAFESNYSGGGPQSSNQVWLVRSDGTGLRQLSVGPGAASGPSISADGSTVAFVQGGQVLRASTAPQAVPPIARTAYSISEARDAVLSDDASEVVFTVGPSLQSSAAVYRIDTFSHPHPGPLELIKIYAPRFLSPNGVASILGGAPSPGSLFSMYGANLGPDELVQANGFPLPTSLKEPSSLNEISLYVNGQAVPLLAVTPWQINAQLPQSVPVGTAKFQVHDSDGFNLGAVSATVEDFAPMNFVYPFASGRVSYQQAAAFHAGTGMAADMDHPAVAGETLEIYGLGLGVTNPMVQAGAASPSSPLARSVQTPRVQIGGRDATVTFAGLVPGFAGLYQVNAVVPAGLAAGLQSVLWRAGSGAVGGSSVAVK